MLNKERTLDPVLLSISFKFKVGESVMVSRRKMAGQNKEGGAALITLISFSNGAVLYDIKYVHSRSTENGLPEARDYYCTWDANRSN